jgi:crossover junction endodeoxyribonuclease RuvC
MENYFIGLDLSINGTGFVIIDNEAKIINQKLITTNPKDDIEDRFLNIIKELEIIYNNTNVLQKVYIEGLSYQSVSSNAAQLAGIHFIVRLELKKNILDYKDKVEIIPPGVLKKFVTGKGNCKKNLILLNVFKKFGETFDDDNLADAYSLARLALFNYNKEKEINNGKNS